MLVGYFIPVYCKVTDKYRRKTDTSINNKGDRKNIQGFATGLVYGDKITLEYYLPKDIQEQGIISIARVVHGYRYIKMFNNSISNDKNGNSFQGFDDAPSCMINVNCSPEGDNWQKEKNAVALAIVDNGTRMCTGSLLNNTAEDFTPYFITTAGCLFNNSLIQIYDPISNPHINNIIFYWHYESPGCNSSTAPVPKSTVGAVVKAGYTNHSSNSSICFTLLCLKEDPLTVSGITPYYLGWDRTNNIGNSAVGIFHPWGDIKKIAILTNITTAYYTSGLECWQAYWTESQNGRSFISAYVGNNWGNGSETGSPFLNTNYKRFVGQYNGSSAYTPSGYDLCTAPFNAASFFANYDKLSSMWENNTTDSRSRLKDWLDPLGTNQSGIDGLELNCSDILVSGTRPTPPQTFERVVCKRIKVQNATVPSGRTLELKATEKVTIDSTFKVESGATFIIW